MFSNTIDEIRHLQLYADGINRGLEELNSNIIKYVAISDQIACLLNQITEKFLIESVSNHSHTLLE